MTPENLTLLGHRGTRVDPGDATRSPIRCMMLRYDLEKVLLSGDLTVDLPGAWRDGKGVSRCGEDDRDDCLQDIHCHGSFGYFPTYTLGALAAFFSTARDRCRICMRLSPPVFSSLLTWLIENVHSVGSLKTADEIISAATGTALRRCVSGPSGRAVSLTGHSAGRCLFGVCSGKGQDSALSCGRFGHDYARERDMRPSERHHKLPLTERKIIPMPIMPNIVPNTASLAF